VKDRQLPNAPPPSPRGPGNHEQPAYGCGGNQWIVRRRSRIDEAAKIHGCPLPGLEIFFSHVHLRGGPAPVRDYLPELIDLILTGLINPGKVFDLELPLDQAAEGYKAMDERRAIKVLLRP
jgi:threonine dehydrogenase-like Zn-dependent dehydrogenase